MVMWVDSCQAPPVASAGSSGSGLAVRMVGVPAVLMMALAVLTGWDSNTPTRQDPAGGWVVESVTYQGERGGPGAHRVTCVHPAFPDRWRDVVVGTAVADTIADGAPCPPGSVVHG